MPQMQAHVDTPHELGGGACASLQKTKEGKSLWNGTGKGEGMPLVGCRGQGSAQRETPPMRLREGGLIKRIRTIHKRDILRTPHKEGGTSNPSRLGQDDGARGGGWLGSTKREA
jgi:hypothetical protein